MDSHANECTQSTQLCTSNIHAFYTNTYTQKSCCYAHTYTNTYTHNYTFTNTQTCFHNHTQAWIGTHAYTRTHALVLTCTHANTHTYNILTHARLYYHTFTHTLAQIRIHVLTIKKYIY